MHKNRRRLCSHSLRTHIWLYFILYVVIVFVLLWVFQIVFLEKFYDRMKIADIRNVAEQMISNYGKEEYEELYDQLAYENDLCIEVMDRYYRSLYSRDLMGGSCLLHGYRNDVYAMIHQIQQSENGVIFGEIEASGQANMDMLVYGAVVGSLEEPKGYILLNTPLVPVGSTVSIIKRQLIIISVLLVLVGLVLSIYLSGRLARPIADITRSAERLARGDYSVRFDGGNYRELQQLAGTLTYAGQEISRVDTLQRDLIANVSHDLRTPLTMLKAYAEMIRDLSGDNPKKREEHLGVIIEETDRLALMVNDILDLSKLESGGLALNPSAFNITEKLSEIVERYRGLSVKTGYQFDFQPDAERTVFCDAGKIEQVICNLINNAMNYTGADKQVYITQTNLPDGVKISVRDTGEGIEEEKLKLIFDKYYRSANHKREVVGTGLGLSIVKAILKLHNYSYGVDSTIGAGSTFWFIIHLDSAADPQKTTKTEE